MPLTLATKMESNGIIFLKMSLMTLTFSLKKMSEMRRKLGRKEKSGKKRR